MVHRDIKPQNLMLIREGKRHTVKVLDFGLAKATRSEDVETGLTGTGAMMGTPGYVAPEQSLDAAKADIRADVYSLGCTLYHLLSGAPPFTGKSLFEILQAHHSTEARPLNLVRPEVSEELAAVVWKMMAKDPAARYQTPAEVVRVLDPFVQSGPKPPPTAAPARQGREVATPKVQALLHQETVLAETQRVAAGGKSTPSPPSPAPSKGARNWSIALLAGLFVCGLLGIGAVVVLATRHTPLASELEKTRTAIRAGEPNPRRKEETSGPPELPPSVTNSLGMKLVLVKPGVFLMGSPDDEAERYNDEFQHEVARSPGRSTWVSTR